jgi:hypothetical protein
MFGDFYPQFLYSTLGFFDSFHGKGLYGLNENNARGYRKPVREITKQCQLEKLATKSATRDRKLQAQRHSCGAFLPFSGRFYSLPVQKSVGFSILSG